MKTFNLHHHIVKGNAQGFVILQGMIAMAIFGVFMTAVVYMMTGTIRANALAAKIAEATFRAADTIEVISGLPLNDPRLTGNSYPDILPDPLDVVKYTTTVTTTPGGTIPNGIDIQVEVSWPDPMGTMVGGVRVKSVIIRDILT